MYSLWSLSFFDDVRRNPYIQHIVIVFIVFTDITSKREHPRNYILSDSFKVNTRYLKKY